MKWIFFVAAKKFVAGIQFCRSATSFGSDKFFMKRPAGVPQKSELSNFIILIFENIAYFDFIRWNIVCWKEWYQDHWNWLSSFDSTVISQNIVIVMIFSPFSWHFSQGLWQFWLPYIVARKPIDLCRQSKERAVNSSCRLLTKFVNDCVSRNGCRINTT